MTKIYAPVAAEPLPKQLATIQKSLEVRILKLFKFIIQVHFLGHSICNESDLSIVIH